MATEYRNTTHIIGKHTDKLTTDKVGNIRRGKGGVDKHVGMYPNVVEKCCLHLVKHGHSLFRVSLSPFLLFLVHPRS